MQASQEKETAIQRTSKDLEEFKQQSSTLEKKLTTYQSLSKSQIKSLTDAKEKAAAEHNVEKAKLTAQIKDYEEQRAEVDKKL